MTTTLWYIGALLCATGVIVLFASNWLPHKPGYVSPVQHHTRTAGQIAFVIGMLLALISQILQKPSLH